MEGCFEEAALLEDVSEWLCLAASACERDAHQKVNQDLVGKAALGSGKQAANKRDRETALILC